MPLSDAAQSLVDTLNERTPKVGIEILDARVARQMQRDNAVGQPRIPLARVGNCAKDLPTVSPQSRSAYTRQTWPHLCVR